MIFILLFIHWIADFVLQTDYQAKNKSTSKLVLLQHVLSYTLVFGLLIIGVALEYYSLLNYFYFLLITGTSHFVTDYFTSKVTKKLYNEGDIHNFFVVVGFDQFLHFIQLILTYNFLLGIIIIF